MDNKELLKSHVKRINDAVRFNNPDRVPHISFIMQWMVFNYGETLTNALHDWTVFEKSIRNFAEEYKFDMYSNPGMTLCNPMAMIEDIGEGFNIIDEANGSINVKDFRLLMSDEYDAFIKDPQRFTWEVMLPRKFKKWTKLKVKDMQKPIYEFNSYIGAMMKIQNMLYDELASPNSDEFVMGLSGIDTLFCQLCGIEGTSVDLRRQESKLREVCDLLEADVDQKLANMTLKNKNPDKFFAFDSTLALLSHTFLNKKQFEKFYMPLLSKVFNKVIDQNMTVQLGTQGQIGRLSEYFSDIPKGHLAIRVEMDDLRTMRKLLPNVCLVGGITPDMLGRSTKEACLDQVKGLISDLHQGGGLILSANKGLTYRNDAKPENLKAVCDYIAGL